MRFGARRAMPAAMSLAVAVLALGVTACGGSKKQQQQDPVSMAMQTPGIRMLVIPEQRDDLTVAIPPCGQAQAAAAQTTTKIPPGPTRSSCRAAR